MNYPPIIAAAFATALLLTGFHLVPNVGGRDGRVPTVSADVSGTSGGAGSRDSANGGGGH
jgi:hypothetical protein